MYVRRLDLELRPFRKSPIARFGLVCGSGKLIEGASLESAGTHCHS